MLSDVIVLDHQLCLVPRDCLVPPRHDVEVYLSIRRYLTDPVPSRLGKVVPSYVNGILLLLFSL